MEKPTKAVVLFSEVGRLKLTWAESFALPLDLEKAAESVRRVGFHQFEDAKYIKVERDRPDGGVVYVFGAPVGRWEVLGEV